MWLRAACWACVPNTEPRDLIIPSRRSFRAFVHSGEALCRPATVGLRLPEAWRGGLSWGLDLEMAIIPVSGAVNGMSEWLEVEPRPPSTFLRGEQRRLLQGGDWWVRAGAAAWAEIC